MTEASPALSVDRLAALVASHEIDTVVVAITDMQGACRESASTAAHFLDDVVTGGTEGCNYLLAVDVEMNTVDGYAMSSWERGYGDFVMRAGPLDAAAACLGTRGRRSASRTSQWADGTPVVASPRQILQRQSERLAAHGWHALAATELEFIVFDDTYEQAWHGRLPGRSRRPTSTTSTTRSSARAGSSRCCGASAHEMARRGHVGRVGQGRVQPRPARDRLPLHGPRRQGRRALRCSRWEPRRSPPRRATASPSWRSSTSARATPATSTSRSATTRTSPSSSATAAHGFSPVFEHFLAGLLASLRELTLLVAPNINSYKRFVRGSFAPTALAWGHDNRTCALPRRRARPDGLRVECRVPGGDVNPYLALAAMVAGGLHGIEEGARARARVRRQRLRRRTSRACRRPCGRRPPSSPPARWPARPSATTSSTTTRTWPVSSSTPSTPP